MAATCKSFFSMGEHTLKVPMELFALNRKRLAKELSSVAPKSVVILEGGKDVSFYCTDVDYKFEQESYFNWMFGVREPGFFGALAVSSGKSYLFIPRLSDDYCTFMGKIKTPEDFKRYYEVDEVHYNDQIKAVLKSLSPDKLLTLFGQNTDSGYSCKEAIFDGIREFHVDNQILHPVIAECRVKKTPLEMDVIRYTNRISSDAHRTVMEKVRPGMYEYQAEAIFLHYCYYVGGARSEAYTCICGSGENAAILHYGHAGAPNNKRIEDGDLCLFDMGCKYAGYTSDITVTFPVNGKFTDDQKAIYNAVLAARNAVIASMKPGVSWVDMHMLAYREMLVELRKYGLLKGDIDDMIKAGIGGLLQPHGLGHLLGCDVHDVGGYLDGHPSRPTEPGFNRLRTARILEAGMVLTVEPGCYFNQVSLDKALEDRNIAKFFNVCVLQRMMNCGSVRIEDDVYVTEFGAEVITDVPRTVEEIECWMARLKQPNSTDEPDTTNKSTSMTVL